MNYSFIWRVPVFKKAANATIRKRDMCRKFQKVLVLFLFSGFFQSYASVLEQQRLDFLQAEQMIAAGDEPGYVAISSGLETYPLNFYLQYQWLRLHLDQDKQILNFLNNSNQSLYARKLRRKWLAYLYKHGKWNTFVANYRPSKSKVMQCRYNWAEYQGNYKTKALTATQKIWLTSASLPKACDPLLNKFTQSSFLTQKLVWQRFMLAAKARQYNLATYLSKKLSSAGDRKKSALWLKLIKNPQLISQADFFQGGAKSQQAEMFTYAMKRLVSADVESAARLWDTQSSAFKLSAA
jgi:soluble lytic murein transglycosylase